MKKLVVIAAAAASLMASQAAFAGWANSDSKLKQIVAQKVTHETGQVTKSEDISLHDVERKSTTVAWQATTPNGEYYCSGDDMLYTSECTRLKKP
jgi:hypothetical protein